MLFHPVGLEWTQGSGVSDPFLGATDATGSAISFGSLCPQGTSFPEKPRGSPKKFFNYTGVSALSLKTLRVLLLKQTMWDPVTKRILPKAITHKLRFLLTSPKVSSPGQPCCCWLRGQAVGHRGRQHLLYPHTVFQAEQPAGFLESWRHSVLPTTLQGPWRGLLPPHPPPSGQIALVSTEPQSRRPAGKPRRGLCFRGCHLQP